MKKNAPSRPRSPEETQHEDTSMPAETRLLARWPSRGKVEFRNKLLRWYESSRRDLPWRGSRDPYTVWISEIMLQQTRVAAVVPYFHSFVEAFGDVRALAAAEQDEVLARWSGLGYYRRARMLHRAARSIVQEHGCEFPRTAAILRTLPGIGRYTAAAIASIAFGEPVAVVDGNVHRVLTRIVRAPISAEQSWHLAGALVSPSAPGDFNQAMMELGATVCTPRNPLCSSCPVEGLCFTRGEHPTITAPARHKRTACYRLRQNAGGRVLLQQRDAGERLMPLMWELPPYRPKQGEQPRLRVRHSITDTDYEVLVFAAERGRIARAQRWIAAVELPRLPLTGLARKILRRAQLLPL